jgi:peptidoglycan/LPS O-acetylase OafA/YrhL
LSTTTPFKYRHGDYRADIDGLRAIAVLFVIFFHAFPDALPGGFIGVDIFFVISGYLISKHIWEELASNSFSIRKFYARRVRRIFPALILVLLASLLFGWLVLAPGEYEQLGKHVAGGAGFVSNFILWGETGYFDNAADTKPLLHLWSLGIEEQFYIAWPLILGYLWRRPHHAWWALPMLLGASFAYSLYLVRHDPVADFYSPLTRFWELALGALIAHQAAQRYCASTASRQRLSVLGLGLILAGTFMLDSASPFPGVWALLPVLGASCLIHAGPHSWLNRHFLSHRWLVWVGLISYPLYLWHWPLLSFARIMESATPGTLLRIALLLAGFLLAWLTYRLLERPIRTRPRSRGIIWALCLSMLLLLAAGEAIRKLDGVSTRKLSMLEGDPATLVLGADRASLQHECGLTDEQKPLFQYCLQKLDDSPFMLMGDSKAEALFYGLARHAPEDGQWRMIGTVYPPASGTPPDDKQQLKNRIALDYVLQDPAIRIVAIATALRTIFPIDATTGFITSDAFPVDRFEAYDLAIGRMEQAGKHVVFVMDNPTFPDPKSCISGGVTSSPLLNEVLRRRSNPLCTLRYSDHLAGTAAYGRFVAELQARHPQMKVFDQNLLLCDVGDDLCAVTRDGKFLYSYGDHISDYANSMVAQELISSLRDDRPARKTPR